MVLKVKDPNKLEENPVYMTQYIVYTCNIMFVSSAAQYFK